MGWRWNRQLHPRQLKGTSSRTRIIAGVFCQRMKPCYYLWLYNVLHASTGMRRGSSPKHTAMYRMIPPATRIELVAVGWYVKLPWHATQPSHYLNPLKLPTYYRILTANYSTKPHHSMRAYSAIELHHSSHSTLHSPQHLF
jgi:hypothetical protein